MLRIREKATESEAIVKNITKDIQSLDVAKKNLSLSMTALKRLQMLGSFLCQSAYFARDAHGHLQVNALSDLEQLVQAKKYADIVQTLAVCTLRCDYKHNTEEMCRQ